MYLLLLFFLISFALVGARYLFAKAGFYLPGKLSRILLVIHWVLFLMSVSAFVLARYNIYWRGYRSTSFIIIFTSVTGLLITWLHKYKSQLFVLFVLIVFVETIFATILIWDMKGSYKESLYYNDDTYRLENTERFIMAHPSLPDLFVKKGLFEKKYILNDRFYAYQLSIYQIKAASLQELTKNKVRLTFIHTAGTINGLTNPLIIDVDLNK